MTVDQLITKARHAIETGQPNLACIYMRKALADLEAAKPRKDPIGDFVRSLADGLDRFINAMAAIASGASAASKQTQDQFVLMPPPLFPYSTPAKGWRAESVTFPGPTFYVRGSHGP